MSSTSSHSIPFTQFRDELSGFMDRCTQRGERFFVRRHSEESVVVISKQEWDEISETMKIIGNPALFKQLIKSQHDIEAGRDRAAEDVFADIDSED